MGEGKNLWRFLMTRIFRYVVNKGCPTIIRTPSLLLASNAKFSLNFGGQNRRREPRDGMGFFFVLLQQQQHRQPLRKVSYLNNGVDFFAILFSFSKP